MNKQKLLTPKDFRDFLPVKSSKKTRAGIFIDDANFFYAQKQAGWKIDWEKFIDLIKSGINLKIVRYYMGMPTSGKSRISNIKHQKRLEGFGYSVVTKPLKKIYLNKSKGKFIVLSNQKQIIFMCFEKNMPWEIRMSKFVLIEKMRKLVELN